MVIYNNPAPTSQIFLNPTPRAIGKQTAGGKVLARFGVQKRVFERLRSRFKRLFGERFQPHSG